MEPDNSNPKPDPTFTPIADTDVAGSQPPAPASYNPAPAPLPLTPYNAAPSVPPAQPVVSPLPDNNPIFPVPPSAPATPPAPIAVPGEVVSGNFGPSPMPNATPGQVVSGGFDPAATVNPSAYSPQPIDPQQFFRAPPVPGPPMPGPVVGASDPLAAAAAPAEGWRSSKFRPILIAVAAVWIIGAGSAAAYFGVIVPNKPANVLKAAFINTLQQKQSSTKGTISASSGGTAYKVTFSSAEDSVAKAADLQVNLTVSGVSFPVEGRLVGHNAYVKVGDLSSIAGLAGAYDPSATGTIQSLNSTLSNKWIVFDSTLLDESSGVKCALDTNWTLTKDDVTLLGNQYGKHPFAVIKSNSGDTIAGKSAEKFVLSIDNAKLNDYGNSVRNLSLLKNLSKCLGGTDQSTSSSQNHGHTPLTVWVDKGSKRIVQIANTSGSAKSGDSVTTTIGLSYGKVSINAPHNAEPAVQVLASLQTTLGSSGIDLSQLLGAYGGQQSKAQDTKRQVDMQSIQTQLEAYFSQNGYYPSLADINSSGWRQINMASFDDTAMQDPDAASGTALSLASTPGVKVYAYQVTNSQGASCEADATQCAKYTLTATLSDGKTYTKNNLD